MKKTIKILLIVIILIFLVHVFINLLVFINKQVIIQKILPNVQIESKRIYFVLPNFLFVHKIKLATAEININIENIIFNVNFIRFLKKEFVVDSIKTYNAEIKFLETRKISQLETKDVTNTIKKVFQQMPHVLKLKNVKLCFNSQSIIINNIVKFKTEKDKKKFFINGNFKNYVFDINLYVDVNKERWSLKGRVRPVVGNMLLDKNSYIDFISKGNFDFSQFSDYLIKFVLNEKYSGKLVGKFKIFPLEVLGEIKNKVVEGKFYVLYNQPKFSLNYNGNINIEELVGSSTTKFVKTANFYLSLDYVGSNGYNINFSLTDKDFLFVSYLKNNNGEFKLKYNDFYVNGVIAYDVSSRILSIYNKNETKPFNIKIWTQKPYIWLAEGKVLQYKISSFVSLLNNNLRINNEASSDFIHTKFEFDTNFSTVTAFLKYLDKNNHMAVNIKTSLCKKSLDFSINCQNFDIKTNKVSFDAYGEVYKNKNGGYIYAATVKNCYVNKNFIAESVDVSGSYYNNLLLFKIISNIISADGKWNLNNNFFDIIFDVRKKNFYFGKNNNIKADIYAKIKFSKENEINLKGSYKIQNVYYNGKFLVDTIYGEVVSEKNKQIFLFGKINKKEYQYQAKINFSDNNIQLKVFNVPLLSWLAITQPYTTELYIDLNSAVLNKLSATGKIYNDTSEIVITSATASFNTAEIVAKIKNVNIKNNYIIGDIKTNLTTDHQKNLTEAKISVSNLWVNNCPFDKLIIKFYYNVKQKEIMFVPQEEKILSPETFNIAGKIKLIPNITFDGFKFYNNVGQTLVINGSVGRKNDMLQIELSKMPLQIISGILNVSKFNINGTVNAKSVIKTVIPEKSYYKIGVNFAAKNLEVETLKINSLFGKILVDNNYVSVDNINLIFDHEQKITIDGNYNIKNKNLYFKITSQKSTLSIFNNFYNIIDTAQGNLNVDLNIKGTINTPKIYGTITIDKGKIKFAKYLKYLDNVNTKLSFVGDNIQIEKFVGEYEQTKFVVQGNFSWKDKYEIWAKTYGGNGIFVSIPELSFPVVRFLKIDKSATVFTSNGNIHFDLRIKKQSDSSQPEIYGEISLNNTHFTYPGSGGIKKKFMLDKYRHNIILVAKNNVWYENESMSVNITGKINFKYEDKIQKSNINGEVQALRGSVNFLNTQFDIKSGVLEIINRDVYLELTAQTYIITPQQERINIELVIPRAKIEEIKPKLVSRTYPELKTEDIAVLLLGVGTIHKEQDKIEVLASGNINIDYTSLLRTQFIKLIDTTFATPIVKNILQKWGIADNVVITQTKTDFVSKQTDTTLAEQTGPTVKISDIIKNTKYGIEKYLSSDMVIGYSIALAEVQNKLNLKHEFEISYRLKNNIFIKGIYDYGIKDTTGGRYGGDIRIQIEPQFRFKSWVEEEEEK